MIKEINELHKIIMKHYGEVLNEYNLSYMQSVMLREIYNSNDTLNSKKIEKLTKQNKRLVSINLQKLEQLYLIEKIEDDNDKRNKNILVTDYGLSVCEELESLDAGIEEYFLAKLDREEVDRFVQLTSKLKNNE